MTRRLSPPPTAGYVKRFRGLTIFAKLGHPFCQRISHIFFGHELLDPNANYRAAYITVQGISPKYGRSRETLPINAIDALWNHLELGTGHPIARRSG
ncbi:MAG: hypothetical protein L0I29_01580 [Hyphomicrobiales bacterium]|nr:hypothetical protein [Hyphomicrobiales bacterium]